MRARQRRALLTVGQLLLLSLVGVLAYTGFHAVWDTTDGQVIDPELDPAAPGYEAFVEPTPTMSILGRAADGTLSWIAVLGLTGARGEGGHVILLPAVTLAPAFATSLDTVAQLDALAGAAATTQSVADILGVAMGDSADVDPTRLAQLVRPVAPLAFPNPDAADGFAAGPVTLAAEDAAAFLLATEAGESELTRLSRHEAFWQAWLAAVAASADPDAVPGETTRGIGRFIRGIAGGPVSIDVPPLVDQPARDGSPAYWADPVTTYDFAEERIPFPAGARPGFRSRVRVLDGVGADSLAVRVSRDVVGAGGQIVVIGNADRFGLATSRVVYFEPVVAEQAAAVAAVLGVEPEQLPGPNPTEGIDITVVAGADLAATYGLSPRETNGEGTG